MWSMCWYCSYSSNYVMLSCLIIVLTLPIIILLTFLSIYNYWSIYWVVDCFIHWVRLLIINFIAVVVMLSFCSIFHLWFVWFSTCLSFALVRRNRTLAGAARTFKAASLTNMTRDSRNCGHLGMLNLFSCTKALLAPWQDELSWHHHCMHSWQWWFKAASLTNMTRDSRNCGHLGMLNFFSWTKAPSPQN